MNNFYMDNKNGRIAIRLFGKYWFFFSELAFFHNTKIDNTYFHNIEINKTEIYISPCNVGLFLTRIELSFLS